MQAYLFSKQYDFGNWSLMFVLYLSVAKWRQLFHLATILVSSRFAFIVKTALNYVS